MDPNLTPVMAAPDGQVSNFNSPMSEVQRRFLVIYAGTLAAATFTLILRIYTRGWIVKAFWLDDYALIASWFMDIGFMISCIRWMEYGFGQHMWNVSVTMLGKYVELVTAVVTIYCWAPMLSKFSILLLYHRVNPNKIFRGCVYFLMVMITAYTIATTVIVAGGCKPTDPTKTQCINNLALAQAILNIVSDAFIVVLPIPMIHALQIPMAQKFALGIVMLGGSFVVVASIIRLKIIQDLPNQTDTTWVEAQVCIWSAIELNVGVMCNCLIVLKPLIQKYGGALLSYSGNSNPSGLSRFKKSVQKSRERSASFPLESIEGAGGVKVGAHHSHEKSGDNKKNNVWVTRTIDIEEGSSIEEQYPTGHSGAKGWKDSDAESQLGIVKGEANPRHHR